MMAKLFKDYTSLNFPGKHNQERVVMFFRRHPFQLIIGYVYLGFLATGIFLILLIAPFFFDTLSEPFWRAVFDFFLILGMLIVFYSVFVMWVHYYLDVYIVTDERIVLINQIDFFHRKVSEAEVENIQDVEIEVKGLFATIIGFGDIRVTTASADQDLIIFDNIGDPYRVKDIILDVADDTPRKGYYRNSYAKDPSGRNSEPHAHQSDHPPRK